LAEVKSNRKKPGGTKLDQQSRNGPRYSSLRFFLAVLSLSLLVALVVLNHHVALAQNAGSGGVAKAAETQATEARLTEDRLKDSAWWPTKGGGSSNEYVGAAECGTCHDSKFNEAQKTAMAHAAAHVREAQSIRQHNRLDFKTGSYNYQISSAGGRSVLRVSSRGASYSTDLMWAFGIGRIAQTYVYEQKGNFYESHVSFYTALQALDVTPGHPHGIPPNLEEAAGRLMPVTETQRCFGCHTTASLTNVGLDTRTAVPGVTCEACHGPGAKHVAAVKSGHFDLAMQSIVNPARLNPVDSVDFCGACHRTLQDVVADGPVRKAALNVRFAPYRLENSRCWKEGKGEARITCITCHDPHRPLVMDPASYDSACLKCHAAASASVAARDVAEGHQAVDQQSEDRKTERHKTERQRTACPIGVKLCVTCHMPQFKSDGFHFTFTDHWIRIEDNGAPLPD
jgi:hypothetical protein